MTDFNMKEYDYNSQQLDSNSPISDIKYRIMLFYGFRKR